MGKTNKSGRATTKKIHFLRSILKKKKTTTTTQNPSWVSLCALKIFMPSVLSPCITFHALQSCHFSNEADSGINSQKSKIFTSNLCRGGGGALPLSCLAVNCSHLFATALVRSCQALDFSHLFHGIRNQSTSIAGWRGGRHERGG